MITGTSATGNTVANNIIGLISAGTKILGNSQAGVAIFSASNVVGAKNVISGNLQGVLISGPAATGNEVTGNLIGTDETGEADLGNAQEGVRIEGAANTVIEGNGSGSQVISGNNNGVEIDGASSTGNIIQGNFIGTDRTGALALGNSQSGILIVSAADNTVGGTSAPTTQNLISANHWGVTITGATAMDNLVEGNLIGTDITGTLPLGNEIDGVLITQGASGNDLGGTPTGAGNTIDFNLHNGVGVVGVTTTGNSIVSNLIFGNGLLGIDLGDDGVTMNQATATPGPNNFQNFPVISSVASSGATISVGGTLNSVANTSFLLQFYSNAVATASGYGPGQTLLGSATVITGASGSATFNAMVAGPLSIGSLVSATATNLITGDTSEFALDVAFQLTTQFSAATYTVAETAGTATITVVRSSGSVASDVNYATVGGTAVPGVNYTPVSGTLPFAVGQTTGSFVIPVIHDPAITGPLTVGIALSSPTQGLLGTPNTAVLTITDVDTPGALEFGSATLTVSPGATVANVTVLRVGGIVGTVSAAYATSGGTAVPGTDYTSVSGVVTFSAGVTSETIAIPILNSTAGNNKTFSLILSSPTGGATLGTPSTVTVTIAPSSAPSLSLVVTNTNDSGPGSLRQAILDADADTSGRNDITFAIPASTSPLLNIPVSGFDPTSQTWTIKLASPLPPITDQVVIDGYSEAHIAVPFRYPSAISSAIQEIDVTGSGGTFTLTTVAPLPAGTTAPIAFNALPATIQNNLDAILGAGSVSVTGASGSAGVSVVVTFTGAYQSQAIPDLIINGSALTGDSTSVQEATSTVGGVVNAAPTQISSVPNSTAALDGNNAQQRIIVDGSDSGGGKGFEIDSSDSIIIGLIIDGFGVGVSIPGPDDAGDVVQGNFIGQYFVSQFDPITGASLPAPNTQIFTGFGNSLQGVVLGSTNAVIGGFNPDENNVISGNGQQGVEIVAGAVGNQVLGNQIGVAGPSLGGLYVIAPNGSDGVLIIAGGNVGGGSTAGDNGGFASSNVIGGASSGAGNLISANMSNGVHIMGSGATLNLIEGNFIGTAPGGGAAFGQGDPGNSKNGVMIENAPNNIIGGSAAAQNVISANAAVGVLITGNSATGNSVVNNVIGLTSGGATKLGNKGAGVAIFSASNIVGPGNVISSNIQGVLISGPGATGNEVQGNLIGTDLTGESDLGNAQEGVRIDSASNNFVTGDGNGSQVISGNNEGVVIVSVTATATGNLIEGNFIGTDQAGTLPLGNSQSGVLIESSPSNTVGGTSATARNVISANNWGVTITGATAINNVVQGNDIGTDITGTLPLGNELDGVLITQAASSNSIGGTATAAGNTIAFNVDNGVDVVGVTTTGNAILSNLIFGNGLLGIDLGDDGVTLNHATATAGPNNFQNFPVITSVVSSGSSPIIGGTLSSVANTSFLIQFYSNDVATASGYGPGATLLGSATVTTDVNGMATFTASVSGSLSFGSLVSATATNLSTGDTSEFSLDVVYQLTTQFSAAAYTVSETDGTATITVTRSSGSSTSDVNYATGGGTAVAGVNYTASSGTLIFSPGQTSQSFTIPVIHDFQITGPLTVGIALSNATAGSLGTPSAAVLTINDIDQAGAFEFGSSTMTVNTGATVTNVTVLRVGGAGGTVSVAYATGGGTAVPGTDYTSVSGVVTFNPGDTSETIAVPILNSTVGSNKTFSLVLSSPTGGAALGSPSTATITIAPPGAPLVVTNTNDSGPGSLRQAILNADANTSGPNDIQFAIPASTAPLLNIPVPGFDPTTQTWTIDLTSPLPAITSQVDIDGYSQGHFPVSFRYPSAITSAVQAISTSAWPTEAHSRSRRRDRRFRPGPRPRSPSRRPAATIQDDLDAILGPNSVSVTGSSPSIIVTFIGPYADMAIPNLIPTTTIPPGVAGSPATVSTTVVGGVVIDNPIEISSVPNSDNALVGDNAQQRIILNGSGTNGGTGLVIDSSDSIIRGLIIDGFGVGVSIPGPGNVGDVVQGNFIGQYFVSQFDPRTGTAVAAPNGQIFTGMGNSLQGVLLGSTNATIGGLDPSEDNVIDGNGLEGVSILPGAVGNQVLGNQIGIAGPSLGGRYAIAPNGADGVLIDPPPPLSLWR